MRRVVIVTFIIQAVVGYLLLHYGGAGVALPR